MHVGHLAESGEGFAYGLVGGLVGEVADVKAIAHGAVLEKMVRISELAMGREQCSSATRCECAPRCCMNAGRRRTRDRATRPKAAAFRCRILPSRAPRSALSIV